VPADVNLNIDINKKGDGDKEAALGLEMVAKAADNAKDELAQLDRKLLETRAAMVAAGKTFAQTGDQSPLKALLKDERQLTAVQKAISRGAEAIARDLTNAGQQGGRGFFDRFRGAITSGFDSLTGTAPTGLVQWLVAGAVAAAPAVGAAVNAGILLGLGGGALAAGIAGALQNPEVKATWADFGDFLKSGLADASSSFVQPMEAAAVTLRSDFSQVFTVLSRDLDALAPALTRVADGFGSFLTNMLPGLDNALQASGPLLMALGDELPRLGTSISFFFDQIAAGGPGAVTFFTDLMTTTEGTIETLGVLTSSLSKVYELTRTQGTAAGLTGPVGALMSIVEADKQKTKADDDAAQAAANHRARMTDEAFAAQQAKMSIDQLSAAIDKEVNTALAGHNAHLQFNQSLLDLNESVKQNGTSLNDSTAAGIANSNAILRGAAAAEVDRQSTLARTGSVEQATAAFDADMGKLYQHAAALGMDKGQVDNLIGAVQSIPHESTTDIQLKGEKVAEDDIRTFKNYLNSIPRSITTYVDVVTSQVGGPVGVVTGGRVARAQASGGIVAAARGLVANGPTVVFGERTLPEAYIPAPNSGISQGRADMLLGTAASWWGKKIVPAGGARGGGGGGNTFNVTVNVPSGSALDAQDVAQAVRAELTQMARDSDLYARAG
jgi:hypothetical protein